MFIAELILAFVEDKSEIQSSEFCLNSEKVKSV